MSSPVHPDLSDPGQLHKDSTSLPDIDTGMANGQRSRMPYGTGYEAMKRVRATRLATNRVARQKEAWGGGGKSISSFTSGDAS